jgi:hypothetical protein
MPEKTKKIDATDFLPCPFCGVAPSLYVSREYTSISCRNKNCAVVTSATFSGNNRNKKITKAWNTRA